MRLIQTARFGNMVEAYNRLSPEFQKRLHGLEAIHSGHEQAADARARGSVVRREPVANVHPLVRTHPATGEKALYVNPQVCLPLQPRIAGSFYSCLTNHAAVHPSDRRTQEGRE